VGLIVQVKTVRDQALDLDFGRNVGTAAAAVTAVAAIASRTTISAIATIAAFASTGASRTASGAASFPRGTAFAPRRVLGWGGGLGRGLLLLVCHD